MKRKFSVSALLLHSVFSAVLFFAASTTSHGASGNEVNVGEADSQLQVNSQESHSKKATSATSNTSTTTGQHNKSENAIKPLQGKKETKGSTEEDKKKQKKEQKKQY